MNLREFCHVNECDIVLTYSPITQKWTATFTVAFASTVENRLQTQTVSAVSGDPTDALTKLCSNATKQEYTVDINDNIKMKIPPTIVYSESSFPR